MYALYYADKFEFISTVETTLQAAKLAKSLSAVFHRDVVAVFNSEDGRTTPWCTFREGVPYRMNGEWPRAPMANIKDSSALKTPPGEEGS
jgi:hypothetical protein